MVIITVKGLHTDGNLFFFREKKITCIHKTIKSNYLNEDFWLADSDYFDLKETNLFYQK